MKQFVYARLDNAISLVGECLTTGEATELTKALRQRGAGKFWRCWF